MDKKMTDNRTIDERIEKLKVKEYIGPDGAVSLGKLLPRFICLRSLNLSGVGLVEPFGNATKLHGLKVLLQGLSVSRLKRLILSRNNIDCDGVEEICKLVVRNTLQELDLSENNIWERGAERLGKSLIENGSSMQRLNLSGNSIRDRGAKVFAHVLEHEKVCLRVLDLGNNYIFDEGLKCIADCLGSNYMLEELHLENNKIGLRGKHYFAKSLAQNSTLKILNLGESSGNRQKSAKTGSEHHAVEITLDVIVRESMKQRQLQNELKLANETLVTSLASRNDAECHFGIADSKYSKANRVLDIRMEELTTSANRLQQENRALEQQLHQMQEQIKSNEAVVLMLREKRKTTESRRDEAESSLNKLFVHIEKLETTKAELQAKILEKSKQETHIGQTISTLREEYERVSAQHNQLENTCAEGRRTAAKIAAEIETMQERITTYEESNRKSQASLGALQQASRDLQSKVTLKTAENELTNQRINQLEQKRMETNEVLSALESESVRLRSVTQDQQKQYFEQMLKTEESTKEMAGTERKSRDPLSSPILDTTIVSPKKERPKYIRKESLLVDEHVEVEASKFTKLMPSPKISQRKSPNSAATSKFSRDDFIDGDFRDEHVQSSDAASEPLSPPIPPKPLSISGGFSPLSAQTTNHDEDDKEFPTKMTRKPVHLKVQTSVEAMMMEGGNENEEMEMPMSPPPKSPKVQEEAKMLKAVGALTATSPSVESPKASIQEDDDHINHQQELEEKVENEEEDFKAIMRKGQEVSKRVIGNVLWKHPRFIWTSDNFKLLYWTKGNEKSVKKAKKIPIWSITEVEFEKNVKKEKRNSWFNKIKKSVGEPAKIVRLVNRDRRESFEFLFEDQQTAIKWGQGISWALEQTNGSSSNAQASMLNENSIEEYDTHNNKNHAQESIMLMETKEQELGHEENIEYNEENGYSGLDQESKKDFEGEDEHEETIDHSDGEEVQEVYGDRNHNFECPQDLDEEELDCIRRELELVVFESEDQQDMTYKMMRLEVSQRLDLDLEGDEWKAWFRSEIDAILEEDTSSKHSSTPISQHSGQQSPFPELEEM